MNTGRRYVFLQNPSFGYVASSEQRRIFLQFYHVFDTPTDVLTLLGASDIRSALSKQPSNIITLVRVLSRHLSRLLRSAVFPNRSDSSLVDLSAVNVFKLNQRRTSNSDPVTEALNCIRVLSRVLPLVFELDDDGQVEKELLWTSQTTEQGRSIGQRIEEAQFVIDDEEANVTPEQEAAPGPDHSQGPLLGETLLITVVDLLFCPGFCIPADLVDINGEGKISHVIWPV
jgi:High-temperature-induced dauer-formation protein